MIRNADLMDAIVAMSADSLPIQPNPLALCRQRRERRAKPSVRQLRN